MPTPGPLELVIILVIALLILGPGKLPEVGASLGKSIREFRKASSDVQASVSVAPLPAPVPNVLSTAATSVIPPAAPVSPAAASVATEATSEPLPGTTKPSSDSTTVAS